MNFLENIRLSIRSARAKEGLNQEYFQITLSNYKGFPSCVLLENDDFWAKIWIDRRLFSMKSTGTFARVIFLSYILQEKYRIRCLELRKWFFGLDFFTTENVWDGVLTYLSEREILHLLCSSTLKGRVPMSTVTVSFSDTKLTAHRYPLFSSTNHSISHFNSGNERGEACGHFPLSESKNKNQTAEKSLIGFRFDVEEEHIFGYFP